MRDVIGLSLLIVNLFLLLFVPGFPLYLSIILLIVGLLLLDLSMEEKNKKPKEEDKKNESEETV